VFRPARPQTTFSEGARPTGLVICLVVDRPGPWWSGSFMDNSALIGVSLSDVRVIMTILHVLEVKFLCQVATGWIPTLECLLPDTRGRL
jgi:hypothetical protein